MTSTDTKTADETPRDEDLSPSSPLEADARSPEETDGPSEEESLGDQDRPDEANVADLTGEATGEVGEESAAVATSGTPATPPVTRDPNVKLPTPESLEWLEDWSFGFAFAMVVAMFAPPPTLQIAIFVGMVSGTRLVVSTFSLRIAEIMEDAGNIRFHVMTLAILAVLYRSGESNLIGAVMAFFAMLLMTSIGNVQTVIRGLNKQLIKQKSEEIVTAERKARLADQAADRKLIGKGAKKARKKIKKK